MAPIVQAARRGELAGRRTAFRRIASARTSLRSLHRPASPLEMHNEPLVAGDTELGALTEALSRVLASGDLLPRRGGAWDITMPAGLDSPRPSQPFVEPLRGMAMREMAEPFVFGHYFGGARGR
jgi:hypothetical protein